MRNCFQWGDGDSKPVEDFLRMCLDLSAQYDVDGVGMGSVDGKWMGWVGRGYGWGLEDTGGVAGIDWGGIGG